jgi:ribose/xylose/arabinose/galactoside ABC-type transport system permease subunit
MDRLSIQRLRRRLPLPVFVVVLILLVVMLGFVCVCMSDHPTQAAERAISAFGQTPAIIEMWAVAITLMAVVLLTPVVEPKRETGRASPAQLQRFRI